MRKISATTKIGAYIRILETALTRPNQAPSAIASKANTQTSTRYIPELFTLGFLQLHPKRLSRTRFSKSQKTVAVTPKGVAWLHRARTVVDEVSNEKQTVKVTHHNFS